MPDDENRDLRQLLWHRHRLVQMRTRVMNQLHVVALNEGLRRKKALWRAAGRQQLESIALPPWARRRGDLRNLFYFLSESFNLLLRLDIAAGKNTAGIAALKPSKPNLEVRRH